MNWLKIEHNTFVWKNNKSALLYNSDTGLHFACNIDSPETETLFCLLSDSSRLNCIHISDGFLGTTKVNQIIRNIINLKMGQVIQSADPIVSYPPELNLQCDSFRTSQNNIPEDLYWNSYLKEIVLFLTGDLYNNSLAKQVIYPLEGESILPYTSIEKFIDESIRIGVDAISICTTIGKYPYESQLYKKLKNASIYKRLYVCENNFTPSELKQYSLFDEINIIYRGSNLKKVEIGTELSNIKKVILVDNEIDYSFYNGIIQNDNTVSIYPIFTGKNQQFFYNNVFLTHAEILEQKIDKRIIFARQRANLNRFGILSVIPDGNVYSNLLGRPIGTIDNTVQSIIATEMKSNNGWLETRDVAPCCDCLCRWLCPSPTTFEKLLKRPACLEGAPLTT